MPVDADLEAHVMNLVRDSCDTIGEFVWVWNLLLSSRIAGLEHPAVLRHREWSSLSKDMPDTHIDVDILITDVGQS